MKCCKGRFRKHFTGGSCRVCRGCISLYWVCHDGHYTEVHECAGHLLSFDVWEGISPMVKHVVGGCKAK